MTRRNLDEPFVTIIGWERWPTATDEEREEMLRTYRETVRRESEDARATNYRAMDAAITAAGRK